MPVGAGFLSAFLNKLVLPVSLDGDPIFTKEIAVTPGAGGIAFDGTYFYLNYYQGREIYVVSPTGTLINTLSVARVYYDIDYDPITDSIWAVDPTLTGIDRLSKSDGSLLETMTTGLVNDQYTSIALDSYNDRCYLLYHDLYQLLVVKKSTLANVIRIVYFPYLELNQPSTLMVFTGAENMKKFWVGFKSFPVMLGRVEDGVDKIDAVRLLGASFNQVKSSISMRYLNNGWYYWGDWGLLSRANLYRISGMPWASAPRPLLTIPDFDQDTYRWFNDDDAENPTPRADENTELSDIDVDDILRLRLGLKETTGADTVWSGDIKIQHSKDPAGPWTDMPAKGSINVPWRFDNGKGADVNPIANLLLSNATVKQFFVESAPSNYGLEHRSPDRGEWDAALSAWAPESLTDYYFRAISPKGLITSHTRPAKLITKAIDYDWFSDFEADAVGSVPAGWIQEESYFKVRDDQAAVGSHSVRMERTAGLARGKRYFRANPTQLRLQWRWRMEALGGQDRVTRAILYGDAGAFMYIWWSNAPQRFRYYDGSYKYVPNVPAGAVNQWFTIDARMDAETDRWKLIIDGVDSGWIDSWYSATYLDYIRFDNYSGTYAPTNVWIDEVDFSIGLP